MTSTEMKALPRGTRVLRTHDFSRRRKKSLPYVKVMDGTGAHTCVFHLVKPNGTVVNRDQYLYGKEIQLDIQNTQDGSNTDIWVVTWDTESGDSGVVGYWAEKPTTAQLDAYMGRKFPEDYEAKTLYYVIEKLTKVNA